MKHLFPVSLISFLSISLLALLVNTTTSSQDYFSTESIPVETVSNEQTLTFPNADGTKEARKSSAFLMDVDVDASDAYLSQTSGSVGSKTTISSCIVFQTGSGESAYWYYYEVPSGGGSETLKWSNPDPGTPWTGCAYNNTGNEPVFTVATNSKVRVQVVSNSGIEHVHQVDAN